MKLTKVAAVVVTGGSSGIGRTFVKAINYLNDSVVICNLSRTKPDIFFDDSRFKHIPCDLSNSDQIEEAAHKALSYIKEHASDGPMLLINNSGFGAYGPFPEPNIGHNLNMIQVNVSAPVHLTALLQPELIERGGYIVNVSSTASFQPTPQLSTYGATKAFLTNWSLGLDNDLKGSGVRSLALCPGPTSTNFFKRAGFDESPLPGGVGQTSEQVVNATFKAIEREKNLVVSGLFNKTLCFVSSKLPKSLVNSLAGFLLKKIRK